MCGRVRCLFVASLFSTVKNSDCLPPVTLLLLLDNFVHVSQRIPHTIPLRVHSQIVA